MDFAFEHLFLDLTLYVIYIKIIKIDVRYCPSIVCPDARNPFQELWFCNISSWSQ